MDQENPMGALALIYSSIGDWLDSHSSALQLWFSESVRTIDGFQFRKCPAWLEPELFIKACEHTKYDNARFQLKICNKRDIWRVRISMVFHTKARLMEDGTTVGPGILFTVLDDEGRSFFVDYFAISLSALEKSVAPDQWCIFWFNKLARSRQLNRIFAYKTYEAEME